MRGRRKDKRKRDDEMLFGEPGEPRRITPVDIQQKEFRLAMRGYHERDVDEFLDEITEEVARLYADNKRLSEELETRGAGRMIAPDPSGEAEVIVARARTEAARIVEEAEARARSLGAPAAPAGGQAMSGATGAALAGFLSREKSFLQDLARMMQDHAKALKEDVRRIRATATGPAPEATARAAEPTHEAWRPPPVEEEPHASESSVPGPSPSPQREEPLGWKRPTEPSGWERSSEPSGWERKPNEQPEQPSYFMNGPREEAEGEPQQPRPAPPNVDEPTKEWTLGESGLDERDAEELGAASEADRRDRAPASAPRWEPRPEEEAAGDDRSLKELFWGED